MCFLFELKSFTEIPLIIMKKVLLSLFVITFSFAQMVAQKNNAWNKVSSGYVSKLERVHKNLNTDGEIYFTLDNVAMKAALSNATNKTANKAAIEIAIPNKNGVLETYQVWENSNMDPILQAQFPNIRAYVGKGITDKTANINFSLSPQGFQTMVFRPNGQMEFIESYDKEATAYVLFSSKNRNKGRLPFECNTVDTELNQRLLNLSTIANRSSNKVYKTMRLALSCTGEYGVAFGGTVAGALAAMNATMTRVNGVFENDLALHLYIIANNTAVIYTNATTDPYSAAASMSSWNAELQNTLTSVIGAANYDIGHLFGASGGGGNAGCIGCVCSDAQKGSGITSPGSGLPSGDTFDIDYVAHELGHQLGGNHSFTHGYEGTIAQVEPGGGSTIMGYAGITSYNVQANSDAIFAYKNIYQIQTNLATKTCLTSVATANNTPVVNAGLDYTIPKGTPFILTGSATDADASDVLTYTWEQNDLGTSATTTTTSRVLATKAIGPTFRIFAPSTSSVRFLPELSRVVNATQTVTVSSNTYWETVSTVARPLNFTLTARDNQVSAGQTGTDAMLVTVSGTTGPFLVTSQATTGISYAQGSSQTITWDVASTTTLAGAATVDIVLLSNINGNSATFTPLATGVLNNGTVSVVIPSGVISAACRFMVKASGNIFYAINSKSFSIYSASVCAGTPSPGATIASTTSICGSGITNLSLQNATADLGITYQWQSASDVNGVAGSYSDIASATGATYSPTVTSAIWYRCNVTCLGATGTSTPIKINIVVSSSIVPAFTAVAPICSGATLAALPTTSTNGINGTWSPIINAAATTTYTFTPSAGQCATTATMTISVTSTSAPTAAAQVFCAGVTVSNLAATGTAIKWYSVATGGTALTPTTVLINGIYYVSQTLNSCESTRVSVAVTINTTPANTFASSTKTSICSGDSVALSSTSSDGVASILSEGFETFPPSGWTFINAGTGNAWATSTTFYSGAKAISYTYNTTNAANAWAIAPAQNLTAGTTYTIKYWYKVRSSTFPENLKLTVGNSATVAGQTTTLLTQAALVNTTYAQATTTFTPTTTGIYYFGLNCYSALDMYTLYVDEFSVSRSAPANYVWSSSPSGFNSSLQNPGLVTPTTTTTYSVYASNGTCASASSSVAVTVNTTSIPTAAAQVFCASATVANLVATGTAVKWYAALTGGTPLASSTALTTGIYYASQTINSCESARVAVTVSVSSTLLPTFTAVASICSGAALLSLPTLSNNGITGTWSPAMNNLVTTIYTFTPESGQCASSQTMIIEVGSATVIPTFTEVASICSGAALLSLPTLSNNGITGTWSPAMNNLATSTYTFTPASGQCASSQTMTIEVLLITNAPIVIESQILCDKSTVENLIAVGSNIQWYASANGNDPLQATTFLTNNTAYYVSQTLNGCESSRVVVRVLLEALHTYYIDADEDGYGSTQFDLICSTVAPSGYSNNNTDCDDSKNTVWQSGSFYIDADADGYTVGALVTLCYGSTIPSGYITTSLGTDCDDTNNTVWQSGSFYADADGDGYTVGAEVSLCYGSTTPTGYATTSLGTDCNDENNAIWQSGSFYADTDGDGYTVGALVTLCYGSTTPIGYATTSLGTDCNDSKNTVWQSGSFYADADGDGYTVGTLVTLCYGATTPTGYATTFLGTDCDDTKNTVWQSSSFYADADGDGYTVGVLVTLCYGATTPTGYATTSLGSDCNDANASVSAGVALLSQPSNPSICKAVGATTTISVAASGASQTTYQWYSQAATATTWSTLLNSTNYAGVNGAVLTITRTTTTVPATGTKYRVIVSGGQCGVATSNTVSLQEIPTAIAGVITSPAAVCLGDSITFTSGVYTGSTIQWEVSTVSTTSGFVAVAGANGTSFTMNAISFASGSKFYVRHRVASGACSTAISAVKTITVNAVSVPGTISGGGTICSLGGGTLRITGYLGSIQWQYSTDGLNFSNAPTSTTVSSAFPFSTTSTSIVNTSYSVTNVATSTYFRAKITSGVCSSAYSNVVSFTIAPVAIAGTAVVGSTSICAASATTLGLTNYLGTITWQKSTNWTAATPTWSSVIGGTTANVSTGALTASTAFRAKVTIGTCSTVYSATTIVTVSPGAVGGTVAVNVAGTDVCLGSSKAMKVTGNIGTVQWQMSTNGGTTYSDVVGATTTPYTFNTINSNSLFRVVATSGVCVTKAYSNAVQITVTTVPAIAGVISGSSSVCTATAPGSSLTLSGSQGTIVWQKSTNWTAAAPTWATVTGATTTVLSTGSLTVASAYKALLASGSCVATTPTFVVTVSPKIVAKAIAANVTAPAGTATTSALCTTDTTKILTLATGYVGAIQWQTAATATGPWADIAGANSATYAVTNPIVGANYYRVKLISSPCSEGYSTNVLTVWYKTCFTAIVKDQLVTAVYSLKAFPNPFDDTFIIESNSNSNEMLQIAVYDISGKQIDSQKVATDLLSTVVFGKRYAAGVYNVIVQQGEKQVSLRMIKR